MGADWHAFGLHVSLLLLAGSYTLIYMHAARPPFSNVLVAADEALEPAMDTAVSMAEQQMTEAVAPLAEACGAIVDIPQLNVKLDALAAALGMVSNIPQ